MSPFQKLTNGDDFHVWRLINRARRVIRQARTIELKKYGITPDELSILDRIDTLGEKATPSAIGRIGDQSRAAVHEMLKKMLVEKFITKHKDSNKKAVQIRFTKKGREIYYLADKKLSVHSIFSCLADTEKRDLELYLNKLLSKAYEVLDEEEEEAVSP
jgi:DNA-binding MarR family transcriptional regulator